MIDILYFASFREVLGKSEERLEPKFNSVQELLTELGARGDMWQMALSNNPNLQIAVNHTVADRSTQIKSGDEVAFFPPVTGG